MSSFVPIPNFMSNMEPTPIHASLVPRRHNLYSEKFIDVVFKERIEFFTNRESATEKTNMPSAGMLGAPLMFDLEQIVVTFLTRMPNAILEDITNEIKVLWFFMGMQLLVESPLSIWNRSIVKADDLKIERAPFEQEWIENGRSLYFDVVTYNSSGESQPFRIDSNVPFRGVLEHQSIRDDIPRFLVRMTMKGTLWGTP